MAKRKPRLCFIHWQQMTFSERAALLSAICQAISRSIRVDELPHAYGCPEWALTLVANESDLVPLAKAIAEYL